MVYLDIHSHVVSFDNRIVYNLAVNELSRPPIASFLSAGIHPWMADVPQNPVFFSRLVELVNEQKLSLLGECGLDTKCPANFKAQLYWFQQQIELSELKNLPLIIHCVGAFNELVTLRKKHQPKQAWIIHGFGGSKELATSLVKNGMCLSFGKKMLSGDAKTAEALMQIPVENLFFETDNEPDKKQTDIEAVYRKAASIKQCSPESLSQQIQLNFERLKGSY